ncbi:hypothetical protein [Paraburkholderia youngii]|uniref:hypothetical protein n=1 Tax=Paraburkholderia youngii TaxID=2782701 RepID=UPI001FE6D598|nr:hypothetical protein [Paraburkholderia youngii]
MQTILVAPLIAAPMISVHAEPAKQLSSPANVESALPGCCRIGGGRPDEMLTYRQYGFQNRYEWRGEDQCLLDHGGRRHASHLKPSLSFSDEHATVGPVGDPTLQDPLGAPIWRSIRYTGKRDQIVFVATRESWKC